MAYICEECGASFLKLTQLLQHRRVQNHWRTFQCKKTFTRKCNLDVHQKKHDDEDGHHCNHCLKVFISEDALNRHIQGYHEQIGGGAKRARGISPPPNQGKRQKLQKTDNSEEFFDIVKVSEKKIEKFKATAIYYKVAVKDIELRDLPNILKSLKILFQSILDRITVDIPSNDLVRVSMDNPELDYPIVLPFMRRSALTVDRLLSEIERVLQSYEQFVVDETFGIELVHVQTASGSGYKQNHVDIIKMMENKRSIIQIKNKDTLCCARALVTAMARIENDPNWHSIRRGFKIQRDLAVKLHERTNVR